MSDLPAPLVPSEVDLRDFAFMPLDVRRLLTSDTWIEAADDPRVGHALVCLWCEAWHQVPAASLPDNDRVLARLAMCDPQTWKRIKEVTLRGWMKCSDGRFYHPVVAEKALDAWSHKQKQRARAKAGAAARWRSNASGNAEAMLKHCTSNASASPKHSLSNAKAMPKHSSSNAQAMLGDGKGQGQGQVQGTPFPSLRSGNSVPICNELTLVANLDVDGGEKKKRKKLSTTDSENQELSRLIWESYSTSYRDRYNVEPVRNARTNSLIKQFGQRLGKEAPDVIAHFLRSRDAAYVRSGHSLALAVRDAERLRTEWATGRTITATHARQQDRIGASAAIYEKLAGELTDGGADEARAIEGSAGDC